MSQPQQDRSTATAMNLGLSAAAAQRLLTLQAFIREQVLPAEQSFYALTGSDGDRWQYTDQQLHLLAGLKQQARELNLWNLWLAGQHAAVAADGGALTTVDYAYLAEAMGHSRLAAEVCNCSAPDTGNMEVLLRHGSDAQQRAWLDDLLAGEIRSAFAMSEPEVASSDAANIALPARREGDEWVLDGDKHWISGAGDPRCAVHIVMVCSDPDAERHARHSMLLVPTDAPGVEIVRPMLVFGDDDAPHGHMHVRYNNVRVPAGNLIGQRGQGFAIAQDRLGPGRIHHCMRAIGQAERALQLLCERAGNRQAFGRPLARLGGNLDIIADCRMRIEMTRLLCLKAAWMMDQGDPGAAMPWIAMIKVQAPQTALHVIDQAMQMFGGLGVSQDTPLAAMYAWVRTLRYADGPDAVHRMLVGRHELRQRERKTSE